MDNDNFEKKWNNCLNNRRMVGGLIIKKMTLKYIYNNNE